MNERVAPEQCIFCKIVGKQAPAHVVHEDERTLTFMDLFPVADGHVLLIPKRHATNLLDCDDADLSAVITRSRSVASAMREVLGLKGIGVFQLNGAAAGQTVFHYHMHLIPRREGEGLAIHGRGQGDPKRLGEIASRLAKVLRD